MARVSLSLASWGERREGQQAGRQGRLEESREVSRPRPPVPSNTRCRGLSLKKECSCLFLCLKNSNNKLPA